MKIVPAILVKTPEELSSQIKKLSLHFSRYHIDIADGNFVPNTTLTLKEALDNLINYHVIHHDSPRPVVDLHLMVTDYEGALNTLNRYANQIVVERVFIHSKTNPPQSLFKTHTGVYKLGLAINPDEKINKLQDTYDFSKIKYIQIMTVKPGFQGSPFIEESLHKVEQLRTLNYGNKLFLDGGINERILPLILNHQYKPDVLYIGSYLSQSPNIALTLSQMHELGIDH